MNDAETLNQIYELIETERFEEARTRLQPLLEENPDNADLWWLYAHAVEDEAEGRQALERVHEIAPQYPGLQGIMQEADMEAAPAPPAVSTLPPPPGLPETPATTTTAAAADDDITFDDLDDEPESASESRSGGGLPVRLLALVGLLIIAILAIIALTGSPATTPVTPTATVVAQVNGEETEAAATSEAEDATPTQETMDEATVTETAPTEDVATEAATEADPTDAPTVDIPTEAADTTSTGLSDALAEFDLTDNGIETIQTSLGATQVVRVCSPVGPRAGAILNQVMQILAQESAGAEGLEAIAVSLTDCESENRVLRSVAVTIDDAAQFADGTLDDREYQARWQPIDIE